jgi:hypothetical protein
VQNSPSESEDFQSIIAAMTTEERQAVMVATRIAAERLCEAFTLDVKYVDEMVATVAEVFEQPLADTE